MKTNIKSAARSEEVFVRVNANQIPNGGYAGTWSAYTVHFEAQGIKYQLTTTEGIRTLRAACRVNVSDGEITVEAA